MIEPKYKQIKPSDVYISTLQDADNGSYNVYAAMEWIEIRPTGNEFVDMFAKHVHKYKNRTAKQHAQLMGIEKRLHTPAIIALTGMGPHEWVREYLRMASCELLRKTKLSISDVAKIVGFNAVSPFSQFFYRCQKCLPYEWRHNTGYHFSKHRS
ncbi:MAG: helix-turn-helix domain-containing protein [Cytophagaceae bacterium]|nr:helix-turn-helix domain-containing protein [Cytophagaceae bacterium]